MEEFISSATNAFSEFISANKSKFRESGSAHSLVSFAVSLKDYPFEKRLDFLVRLHENSFYFERPSENVQFIGIDEILSVNENGNGRFAATDKAVKEWKKRFFSNWESIGIADLPVFIGSMKFTVEHSDNYWQDFNDSAWFVPEILLYKKNSDSYLIFNLVYTSGTPKEVYQKKFLKKLEKIFKNETAEASNKITRIVNVEGGKPKDRKKWKNLVNQALEKIDGGEAEKIVLSRKVEMQISGELDFSEIMNKLRGKYPGCYLFIHHHGKSSFFGATPEKLVKISGGIWEIDALAGSAPRGKTEEEDLALEKALVNDSKNLNEHNFVIRHIKESIATYCKNINVTDEHGIRKLANIQHIWTKITAESDDPVPMLLLLKDLHPTPAVCGLPKDTALQFIKKNEGYRRGLYSGIIGWFNFNNDGEFAVAIRSALNSGNKLIAFAGGGIVSSSDPDEEFNETELKLNPIMALFEDENKNQ